MMMNADDDEWKSLIFQAPKASWELRFAAKKLES